jgi:glycosyltransferase involved in cell wall biosynthesis
MRKAKKINYKISVILPVYNEKDSFAIIMEKLLAKKIEGVDKEIIIIESNSTDGTKDIVKKYEGRDGVKIIYEDTPRGKGHAVRNGFKQATGEIILIQDADLEYDIDDYDKLLEPIIREEEKFVLGSRHLGANCWRIRQFQKNWLLGFIMNLAHQFFTGLFNILYGQRIKDPTTMYKVFKKECINGVQFECNRFDLDWEMLARLVRRGFTPLEIPIHYKSRCFSEGKKIRFFRDPLTWMIAIFKYRFCK